MSARERFEDALRNAGKYVDTKKALCPAHTDNNASLSIGDRRDGKGIVVKCHAGCDYRDVLAALRMSPRDLFDDVGMRDVYVPKRDYRYPDGRVVHRKPDKSFPQSGNIRGNSLFHADRIGDAETVYWPEGEKDVEAIEAVGGAAVCSAMGAGKAHLADISPLRGTHVVVVADKDEPGRKHAAHVAGLLSGIAATVNIVEAAVGKDAADHIAAGKSLDELVPVEDAVPTDNTPPISLGEAHNVFRRWLGESYDTDALDAMLAAAAVEQLDGDPLWLLIVSGPGNAKTETVQALDGVGATIASAISSEAGLLSATPQRERAKDATGGLLRHLGERGVLGVKDVTSILAMDRNIRGLVLAALREVYDGRWSRTVGVDGGRTIEWSGRVVVVGAVTTAWDSAHAVVASMGDRFVLVRVDSKTGRQAAGRKAIDNTGDEVVMRAELATAVAGVIAGMDHQPIRLSESETGRLLEAADLVTLARTGVEYDYRGDVIDAHAPEMPTRFAKQLAQLVRGGVAIGMDRADALRLAIRCARDSMPPLRLAIIDYLSMYPGSSTVAVRKGIDKPRNTVDRQLQALHMLGVLTCDEQEYGTDGRSRWFYTLAPGIDPDALNAESVPDLLVEVPNPKEESESQSRCDAVSLHGVTHISGTHSCLTAASPEQNAAYRNGLCIDCKAQSPSAGRPRCERCHRTHNNVMAAYDR